MKHLKKEIKDAMQMIQDNETRPYSEVRHFLEIERRKTFTDEEWDVIAYNMDMALMVAEHKNDGYMQEDEGV